MGSHPPSAGFETTDSQATESESTHGRTEQRTSTPAENPTGNPKTVPGAIPGAEHAEIPARVLEAFARRTTLAVQLPDCGTPDTRAHELAVLAWTLLVRQHLPAATILPPDHGEPRQSANQMPDTAASPMPPVPPAPPVHPAAFLPELLPAEPSRKRRMQVEALLGTPIGRHICLAERPETDSKSPRPMSARGLETLELPTPITPLDAVAAVAAAGEYRGPCPALEAIVRNSTGPEASRTQHARFLARTADWCQRLALDEAHQIGGLGVVAEFLTAHLDEQDRELADLTAAFEARGIRLAAERAAFAEERRKAETDSAGLLALLRTLAPRRLADEAERVRDFLTAHPNDLRPAILWHLRRLASGWFPTPNPSAHSARNVDNSQLPDAGTAAEAGPDASPDNPNDTRPGHLP